MGTPAVHSLFLKRNSAQTSVSVPHDSGALGEGIAHSPVNTIRLDPAVALNAEMYGTAAAPIWAWIVSPGPLFQLVIFITEKIMLKQQVVSTSLGQLTVS